MRVQHLFPQTVGVSIRKQRTRFSCYTNVKATVFGVKPPVSTHKSLVSGVILVGATDQTGDRCESSTAAFTCFPNRFKALWNKSSNTLLGVCIQVCRACVCVLWFTASTPSAAMHLWETGFAHRLKCYFPFASYNRRCKTLWLGVRC